MRKILICQNAHVGDLITTLPLAYLIKQHWPNCHITFLYSKYTVDACKLATDIDDFIIWESIKNTPIATLAKQIMKYKFDAIIHVRSNHFISKAAYRAKIKLRIGQGKRLYQRLYLNRRQSSTRHVCDLHASQINLKLLAPLGLPIIYQRSRLTSMIRLQRPDLPSKIKKYLDPQKLNIILHPFSNKSGREWPLDYFFQLVHQLNLSKYHLIITGSSAEGERLQDTPLNNPKYVTNLCGKTSLTELFTLLAYADGIVVSGTGPLHMAAALGTRCLGLFPCKTRIDKTHWGAIGKQATSIDANRQCLGNYSNTDCACMRALTPKMVQGYIEGWHLSRQHKKDHTQIAQELHT